ncbi:MAG: Zn-dependent hydrolase [Bacteroidales bacterium]|nr:Zn-dependent hydrolase [Bacteroidales bacterium]
MKGKISILIVTAALFACSCGNKEEKKEEPKQEVSEMQALVNNYAEVDLTSDLVSELSENQKQMLKKLIEVADIMEEVFWKEAIGEKQEFLASIKDEDARRYAEINYGPWDRLDCNKAFIEGYGEKPKGACFYPADMTDEEFQALDENVRNGWYSVIRRNEDGSLKEVPYHEEYPELLKAADLLDEAAELAEDDGFKNYLKLRAEAFRTDKYFESDCAWMDMKTNLIDFVVGPIESYEDEVNGSRAAHSGQILIKNMEWTRKIEHYNAILQTLQSNLPVEPQYKAESATNSGDMNVYDVVYSAGDCNSASKNIAINLPNDPNVHATKGSRKLQLKNAMKLKFDKILVPIAEILIADDQLKNIDFENAFFQNVMFHEVAHGLGVKFTINPDKKSVRDALGDSYSTIEEAKADMLGLYLVTMLHEMGEIKDQDLMNNYVTFLAGIFRSVRFGASEAHGKANMMEFAYIKENGGFNFDEATGKYSVNLEKMQEAVKSFVTKVIVLQGDGNKPEVDKWIKEKSVVTEDLQKSLDKIAGAGIPKDIVYKQGAEVLGL